MQLSGGGNVPMQQVQQRPVDYVGPRAEAQSADALGRVLDRMSRGAFEEAGTQQQRQALFDVANNPITPEQLEAAKNGDMSAVALGGTYSIYDLALRKARAFELSSAFDTEAKGEVVKVLADVENGVMNSQQAASKLNTLTNGFGKSLAEVDPDAALKFTASMGVYANTVMSKAYELDAKRRKEKQGVLVESNFANDMKLIEPAFEQGFYTDASGATRSVEDFVSVYRKNLSDAALSAGGLPMVKDYMLRFDKAVAEARVNSATKTALADGYMSNPEQGYAMLRAGNLGKMSQIFADMPQDDKSKVIANFMAAVNQRESMVKAQAEVVTQADIREFIPLYNKAQSLPDKSPQRKALAAQIASIAERNPKAVPLSVLNDLLSPPKDGDGDAMVEFNLMAGIYNNTITSPEQIYSRIGKGLTGRQGVTLLNKLMSEDRRSDSELERGLSRLAGIPVIPGQVVVIDPKGAEFKRRSELVIQSDQIRAEAATKGESLTPRQVLNALEKSIGERRNSESARQARTQLESYGKKDWINGSITRDALPGLERKAGSDKIKLNELKRIRTLLEQAEGN